MKILVVHNHYLERGGEDEAVEAEVQMLRKYGHDVIFYERSNTEIKEKSLYRKIKFSFKDIRWSKKTYHEIRSLIQKEKPDLAHIHNTFLGISPSVYDACYDENLAVVQTLHNYRFLCPNGVFYRDGHICEDCLREGMKAAVVHKCWRGSRLLSFLIAQVVRSIRKKSLLKHVNKFIALSQFSRQKYIENGFVDEKIIVKPNFLDVDPCVSYGDGKYVLYVGSLREYKGVRTLLQAWKNVNADVPLKMIGGGPLREEIQENIANQNIEILGPKSFKETLECLQGARFLVLPSECYETFGRVIVEAFACGVPVVVSDIGALAELVSVGQTGFVFRPGDAKDLSHKINSLLEDDALCQEMGRKARQEFESKYTTEKNYDFLLKIYQEALKQGKNEESKDSQRQKFSRYI